MTNDRRVELMTQRINISNFLNEMEKNPTLICGNRTLNLSGYLSLNVDIREVMKEAVNKIDELLGLQKIK